MFLVIALTQPTTKHRKRAMGDTEDIKISSYVLLYKEAFPETLATSSFNCPKASRSSLQRIH
jgi:hypothetical protein